MNIGIAIYQILSGSALSSLSTYIGTRIFPLVIPDDMRAKIGTECALVYQVINNSPNDTNSGVSKLDEMVVQISCYGADYDNVVAVMDDVRTEMDRYIGTVSGINIQSIQYQNERNQFNDKGEVDGYSHDYKIRVGR